MEGSLSDIQFYITQKIVFVSIFLSSDSFSIFLTFSKIDLTLTRPSCSFCTHQGFDLFTHRCLLCWINHLLKQSPQLYPSLYPWHTTCSTSPRYSNSSLFWFLKYCHCGFNPSDNFSNRNELVIYSFRQLKKWLMKIHRVN